MLCLGKKIRCYISGICTFIGKNQDLTGACDRVNTYKTKACLLGKGYENISGSCDLVYLGNAFCTKRHGCDCLCTAYLIDLIYPCNICSNQCAWIYLSVLSGRGCHDNTANTCYFGRKHIH